MPNDGKIPTVQVIKTKLDSTRIATDGDPEIIEENSAEAEGGDEPYNIDEGLAATHDINLDNDEMETQPVDRVAEQIVEDDNQALVEDANRVR